MEDLVEKAGMLSESEGEGLDGDYNKVEITNNEDNEKGSQKKNSIRLVELGPRMTLQLIKIETGVGEGEVMYHSIEEKTQEEIDHNRQQIEKRRKLKEKRKKEQKLNIKKKLRQKAEQK